MADWGLAVKIFTTGVLGVMLVMFLLQVAIQTTSAVIRFAENRNKGNEEQV
jgi:Na+-transporting methylmalonyl-CoA/oxaloacetate decarboxylase gamma subunit